RTVHPRRRRHGRHDARTRHHGRASRDARRLSRQPLGGRAGRTNDRTAQYRRPTRRHPIMSERSVSRQQQAKRWYTVVAPESFDRAELGETLADEPNAVLDRTIETTLGDLTGDAGANNVKLTFRITDVGSDAAYTEFEKHELTRDYQNSLVRRGASKV